MKIALLDREGTVIVDPDYDRVDAVEKVKLLPHTLAGLGHLAAHDFGVIFVTNQSNIGQGRIDQEGFSRIHDRVLELIQPSGINILKTYVCPHCPGDGCACRKPAPGMLLDASKDFNLDLAETFIVGDRLSDIEAGNSMGMKTILVETGKRHVVAEDATYTAANLLDAAQYIVAGEYPE
jgi:D-glycero-D-manno-heptose 1,7-bisphosphate phosphatase